MFDVAAFGALGLGDFVAVVDEGGAGAEQEPGGLGAELGRFLGEESAGAVGGQIVVAGESSEPGVGRELGVPCPKVAGNGRIEAREGLEEREVERHVESRVLDVAHVFEQAAAVVRPIFGNHELGVAGAFIGVEHVAAKTLEPGERFGVIFLVRFRSVAGKVFVEVADGVHAQAVEAEVEPIPGRLGDFQPHFFIAVVYVGHAAGKDAIVERSIRGMPDAGLAETGPALGGTRVAPDEPVAFWRLRVA